jgi:hypothetical protein
MEMISAVMELFVTDQVPEHVLEYFHLFFIQLH